MTLSDDVDDFGEKAAAAADAGPTSKVTVEDINGEINVVVVRFRFGLLLLSCHDGFFPQRYSFFSLSLSY